MAARVCAPRFEMADKLWGIFVQRNLVCSLNGPGFVAQVALPPAMCGLPVGGSQKSLLNFLFLSCSPLLSKTKLV